MKKVFVVALSVMVLCTFSLIAQGQEESDVIKVGKYGPLSGPMSLSGTAGEHGVELAIDQINEQGGLLGKKLEIVSYDDKSSPEQAVKAVTRMIESEHVDVIVGSLHSGNVLAQAPVNEKAKIPQIGLGTSPTWLQQGYKFLFRPVPNTHIINVQIAKTIQELGYKKVGGLGRSDEYGKGGIDDIATQLQGMGIEMVSEWYQPGDTDFTGQIAKLINSGAEAIISYGVDADQGPTMKQLRRLGYAGYVFGPESMNVPSVKEVAGKDADGAIYGSAYVIPNSPEDAIDDYQRQFFEAFVEKFGSMPKSQVAMRAYDATHLLAEAIRIAGTTDGQAVRDALAEIHGYEGLAGTFDFRGNDGEGILEARMFAIKDGKDVLLDDFLK